MNRTVKNCLRASLFAGIVLLGMLTPASATNLTGTFKNPDGSPVTGKLIFRLSQPARLSDNSAQVVPIVKIFNLTNGVLESGAFIYGNDVLVPAGTYYLVRLVDGQNNLVFEQKWSIQGANLDLGTLTPTTTSVLLPSPLLLNSTNPQAVQGPITFSSPVTAFSLTLNGNLNPGAASTYDLGSAANPWRSIHALQWNEYLTAGSTGALASGPSSPPVVTVESTTGGTIANGTYFFKVTYGNKNGETMAGPVQSATVSGGGGLAQLRVALSDLQYTTGSYKFRVYAATSESGPFFAQTPRSLVFNIGSTVAPISISSISRAKGVVTVTSSTPHGLAAGWPVTIAGVGDTSFNATTVVKRVNNSTQFVYFSPGADTSSSGGTVASYGVIRTGNKIWVKTATPSTFTIGQQIILAGISDSSFNGSFRVWDTPSSGAATGQFALVIKHTGADGNSSGGAASWPTGIDGNWHYVGQGGYAIFDALTFTGTQAPTTNSAAIDPLQVSVNNCRTATTGQAAENVRGTVLLGESGTLFQPKYSLTTPLILGWNSCNVIGHFHAAADNYTTTINMPGVSDPNIGVIMFLGRDTYMANFSVVAGGDTHAIMDMAYGNNRHVENFVAKANGASDWAAAIRFYNKDESHNYTYRNFVLWGGRAGVLATNAGIYTTVFEHGRINCGSAESSSAFLHDGGPTNPDIGVIGAVPSNFDVEFRNIDTESNKGPAFDTKNGVLTLFRVTVADSVVSAGAEAASLRMRDNVFSKDYQEGVFVTSSILNGSGNAWATIFYEGNNSTAGIHFFSNQLSSSGSQAIAADLRFTKFVRGAFIGNSGLAFSESAVLGKVVNVNPTAFNHVVALGNFGKVDVPADEVNLVSGRLRLTESLNLSNRKTLSMNANSLETHASNDSTVLHSLDNSGNGAYGGTVQGTRFISTTATGTAPFTVSSTTEVPNLNSQQWRGKQAIDFSGTLDFASIGPQTCSELTLTVSGAVTGNTLAPGWPAALENGLSGIMFISSSDTVKVRLCNLTGSPIDPANQTFLGRVIK